LEAKEAAKMDVREILTVVFLSLGFICFLITAIGVFRLKDFYARLHAAGICEAAGLVLCSVGFLIYEGPSITGLKIFAVFLAVFIASPIGTHIITRVAYKESIKNKEVE
jgi:multicomponent Na+:H+ antiporter subunit G